ncbi:MAG: winged helix-turn-helix transcriptional regulator [Candidatus Nanohalobium sp.]
MTDNEEIILEAVKEGEGLSFTDLKEKTGLSNGVIQYHIEKCEKIKKKKGALIYDHVCENCKYKDKCGDNCIKKELKKPRLRKTLDLLDEGLSQAEIAEEMGLTRATVNYHVNKLREMSLIES